MATSTLVNTNLVMTFDEGTDANGKTMMKRKTFNNVKVGATDDQIFNIAQALIPLQQLPIISVNRNNDLKLSL